MVDAGSAGEGQGLMFRHAGNCYIATAKHVPNNLPQVTIKTEDPVDVGSAFVFTPFWPGLDLAIATARYGVEDRCIIQFETLRQPVAFSQDAEGDLVRILPSGQVERVRMRVSTTRYLEFDATVVEDDDEIYQGTSGAFLFINDRPAGMVVEAIDSRTAKFIRIEEIAMNLDRWLTGRSAAYSATEIRQESDQGDTFDTRLIEAPMEPISPNLGAENVLVEGQPFVFNPSSNMRLVFQVPGETSAILRRVRIHSSAEPSGQSVYALPRRIQIEIDPSLDRSNPIRKWSGQMGPDGLLDTGIIAASYARTITIRLLDAWSSGPIRIDKVEFF